MNNPVVATQRDAYEQPIDPTLLSEEEAEVWVTNMKAEVDRHWWIDANRAVELAGQIIHFGEARHDLRTIALGTMARGDSIKLLGQVDAAWTDLECAGQIFLAAGDQVGWARTRIGRLPLSVDVNRVPQALTEADQARQIFEDADLPSFVVRVLINLAGVHNMRGDHLEALTIFEEALVLSHSLGSEGEFYIGFLHNCIGYAHNYLGNYREAQTHYEAARESFVARGEVSAAAVTEYNVAFLDRARGHYRKALSVLYELSDRLTDQPLEAAMTKRGIVECYLSLNRHQEARNLLADVISTYESQEAAYELAKSLLYLALIEAEMGNFEAAQVALDRAEPTFETRDAVNWLATLWLHRGQIAFRQDDLAAAAQAAEMSGRQFANSHFHIRHGEALLLKGRILKARGELESAAVIASDVLQIGRHGRVPTLQYAAHLLLGQVAEAQHRRTRARRRYLAAALIVARVQRNLTITLRPSFLQNKGDALRHLIRLHIQSENAPAAFEELERAKSQVLLGHLANREQLQWRTDDPQIQLLVSELNQLRDEHQWFYGLAQGQNITGSEDWRPVINPVDAQQETRIREHRIRALTERLYLSTGDTILDRDLQLSDVQTALNQQSVLLEYYNDGRSLWIFVVTADSISMRPLSLSVNELSDLQKKLQFNIDCALRVEPHSTASQNLARLAQRITRRLYEGLITPINKLIADYKRVIVVPYGSLHYLPFNVLHSGERYLAQDKEIVTVPAAGLLTRPPVSRKEGALVLAHSWGGRLKHTAAEAAVVQDLFGGTAYYEIDATQDRLHRPPGKLLHIAAHGEYRIDQPEMSFIQLVDRQLLTDDLMQQDLSYELVTLSACETGRVRVAPGDEVIGLGRGFLYAGAGALIAGLWRINDVQTVRLMDLIYKQLRAGVSKAAALQSAQTTLLTENPTLHPAHWGAFQLIGDARPIV